MSLDFGEVLYLAVWQGTHEGRTGYWLRWVDSLGTLLPFSEERTEEERQRAEEERQRAEQAETLLQQERQKAQAMAARLREMGIDPEQL